MSPDSEKPRELHGPDPYRSPAIPERTPTSWRRGARKVALIVIGVLVFGAALAYWIWSLGAERRAVTALPAAERQQLYRRTLDNLKFCHAHAAERSFQDWCDDQVNLALSFPECDKQCRTLARMPWTEPRR